MATDLTGASNDQLQAVTAALLPGNGTSPLREKGQHARAVILPVAARRRLSLVVLYQLVCVSCELRVSSYIIEPVRGMDSIKCVHDPSTLKYRLPCTVKTSLTGCSPLAARPSGHNRKRNVNY